MNFFIHIGDYGIDYENGFSFAKLKQRKIENQYCCYGKLIERKKKKYWIGISIANTKKENRDFIYDINDKNENKSTGNIGVQGFYYFKKQFIKDFKKYKKKGYEFWVTASDEKRFNVYYRFLSKYGFEKRNKLTLFLKGDR